MNNLTPIQLHSIIANLGIVSQLRGDDKIVFLDKSIDSFKDADGDEGIFFILSIPFPNFIYVHASSVYDANRLTKDSVFMARISDFISHSLVGSYELNDDGTRIGWSAGIYHNHNDDELRENILGVISNFLTNVRLINDLDGPEQSPEQISIERLSLEDSFDSQSSLDCHPLEIIDQSQQQAKDKKITYEITLSDNLHSSVKREAESRIKDLYKYLHKNEFTLPDGYSLRVQHGNNEKDVESGPNKGPYLCIIDSNGNEKKNMKLFMSRRGNLNSYVAISTLLSRL